MCVKQNAKNKNKTHARTHAHPHVRTLLSRPHSARTRQPAGEHGYLHAAMSSKDGPGQNRVGEKTRVRTRSGERAYLLLLRLLLRLRLLLVLRLLFRTMCNHATSSISILEPRTSAAPQQARRSCGRRTCKSHAPPRWPTPDALSVSAAPVVVVTRRSVIFRTSAWRGSRSSIAPPTVLTPTAALVAPSRNKAHACSKGRQARTDEMAHVRWRVIYRELLRNGREKSP